MLPHRLRVTVFGAFGATVEVCFDDLASAGLFLLHGDPGAGKTTLLDAIGFALYGRVPGERGKARRLLVEITRRPARRPRSSSRRAWAAAGCGSPASPRACPEAPGRRNHHRAGQDPARGGRR